MNSAVILQETLGTRRTHCERGGLVTRVVFPEVPPKVSSQLRCEAMRDPRRTLIAARPGSSMWIEPDAADVTGCSDPAGATSNSDVAGLCLDHHRNPCGRISDLQLPVPVRAPLKKHLVCVHAFRLRGPHHAPSRHHRQLYDPALLFQ